MLQKERLRKADAFMGILVFLIGGAIVLEALSFPRGAEMSGVRNDWYVSPALMPYIIGSGLALMGLILFATGLRASGIKAIIGAVRGAAAGLSRIGRPQASTVRFIAVTGVIAISVFLYIPRVDFVIAAAALLAGLMTMFVFDDEKLLLRLVVLWSALALAFFVYCASGLHAKATEGYYFSSDIVGGVVFLAYVVVAAKLSGGQRRAKYASIILLSLAVPLVLVPVFKYLLYIPLPREGGVVALMDFVRYDILDPIQE